MAIPDKPLEVDIDLDELTLGEAVLFEPEGFTLTGFRAFLLDHSNWTREEINGLKLKELKTVAEQFAAKIKEAAVPLSS